MRFRRLRRWWPVLAGVLLALFIYAAWPGRSTFTVSKETTFVTEPLTPDGRVDFQAALNERLRAGVTPDTNANVLLWQALGPRPEGRLMPPEYFRWLGVEQPAEEGEYLIASEKYFHTHLKDQLTKEPADGTDPPPDRLQAWRDELDRVRRWPWQAKDHPNVADWLKRNERALAVTAEAVARPKYYNPLVTARSDPTDPPLANSLLPNVQRCREIANVLKTRAMRKLGEGNPDGAWQDLMICQRLGRQVARGANGIDSLAGIAILTNAANGQATLVSHGRHPSKRLLGWLDDLRRLPPIPPFADKLDAGERFMILDTLTAVAVHGDQLVDTTGANPAKPAAGQPLWDRLFSRNIDWNPALRKANRTMDQYAAGARLPDRAARKAEFAKLADEYEDSKVAAFGRGTWRRLTMSPGERSERIANILIGLLLPTLEKVHDSVDRAEQIQLNLQLALALAAFRADHGRYPSSLAELIPKYLPAIPNDIFSGGPLIYRPDKDDYLLYSVGINEKDDGGRWTDDDPPGDDLRVRMPVPEPKPKAKPGRFPKLDID